MGVKRVFASGFRMLINLVFFGVVLVGATYGTLWASESLGASDAVGFVAGTIMALLVLLFMITYDGESLLDKLIDSR